MSKLAPVDVRAGQVWRDTYGDCPSWANKRRIEVIEVLPNGVHAKVLTSTDGETATPRQAARGTTMQFKTLFAGYELVAGAS